MITTCVVSGKVVKPDGGGLISVSVQANLITGFVHPQDGSFIAPYQVTTTTANDGTWSLTLVETETVEKTLSIAFDFPAGSQNYQRQVYDITVPNQPTANFADLVTQGV